MPLLSFRNSDLIAPCRRRSSASAAAVGARSPWQVLASATATCGSSGSASASKTTPTSSWLSAPSGPLGTAARWAARRALARVRAIAAARATLAKFEYVQRLRISSFSWP